MKNYSFGCILGHSILFVFIIESITAQLISSQSNYLNARLKCEFKDENGDSLLLNCTLLTGSMSSASSSGSSSSSNSQSSSYDNFGIVSVASNSLNDQTSAGSNAAISTSSSGFNLRVGLDRSWRTPWESLSINYNIIRTLIWRNSKLSELGDFIFKDLNFLQRIDLSYNKLQSLNQRAFNNFESRLIELDLSANYFQHISEDLFANKRLQYLEVLKMNDNPIVHLNKRSFSSIGQSLKRIDLNHCQIRSIDVNTFENMKQLESISLIGNHLRHLNELSFNQLALRSFYVHDNPLVCDCHLRWMIDYLKNVEYQQQIHSDSQLYMSSQTTNKPQMMSMSVASQLLKCDQPNSLKSKPNFLDINPDSFMCDIQIALSDNVHEAAFDIGDDAVIVCEVYGDPEPSVYWRFGSKPIEKALNNEHDKYHINEVRSVSNYADSDRPLQATNKTSELRIRNLQASDIGLYTCTAEIVGSNNRKEISFSVKQLRGLSSLTSANGILVSSLNVLASYTTALFNRPLSNWTLLLLLAIFVSLIIFMLVLCTFICWKCRRSSRRKRVEDKLTLTHEQEKLLMFGPTAAVQNGVMPNGTLRDKSKYNLDQLDHSNANQIYANSAYHNLNLANDSSTTLLSSSNNKMTNSIRMAYPNPANQLHNLHNNQMNEIYTNHSLLTTTSTTTGSYLINPNTVAIDASNQTPRYHLLGNQSAQFAAQGLDSYYDDLRYNNNANSNIEENSFNQFASPFRQQQQQQQQSQASFSPITRRDDPTVPLYATLKPKLMMHQQQLRQQQQQYSSSNNYVLYSTIHRNHHSNNNTPPLPIPRGNKMHAFNNSNLPLPPPPPPPPQLPPTKPKRTFEYQLGTHLHSESGAYLLGGEDSLATTIDYEQQQQLQIESESQFSTLNGEKFGKKKRKYLLNQQPEGSTTSLDEEDLDLNDLKDFEDVTFDNLRKPGEEVTRNAQSNQKPFSYFPHEHLKQQINQQQKQFYKQQKAKQRSDVATTNSEQSLLLKSSDKSSSENTVNLNELDSLNVNKNTAVTSELVADVNQHQSIDSANEQVGSNSKIYEETEI